MRRNAKRTRVGISLRVAACRYAARLLDEASTDEQRAAALKDLERAAIAHAAKAGR